MVGGAADVAAVDDERTDSAAAVVAEIVDAPLAAVETVVGPLVVVERVARLLVVVEFVDGRVVDDGSDDRSRTVVSTAPSGGVDVNGRATPESDRSPGCRWGSAAALSGLVDAGNRLIVCGTTGPDPAPPDERRAADPSADAVPNRNPMPRARAARQTARMASHNQPCHPSHGSVSRPTSHQCRRRSR